MMNEPVLSGKSCLVTGSSQGIGYETAVGLARLGAHVIIVSHIPERCQQATKRIQADYGVETARCYAADLSVQDHIRQLSADIQQDYDRLDVLVNNMGGWYSKPQQIADGIEMILALNHLSYFLLTGLLLPLLQESAPARIINVSSDAHRQSRGIQFDDIGFQQRYRSFAVYAHSKLANVTFTYELARRLENTSVTVNALHPGFVKTELYRHFGVMTPLITSLAGLLGKSAAQGAQTPIYLASSPEVAGTTGKYFTECELRESSPVSYQVSQAQRLWQVSEEMTGFRYPI